MQLLRTVMRTRRFHTDAEVILLFKSHILSYVESRTSGIFHASDSVLRPLDRVLERLLNALGISALDALHHFRLAPLRTRRDIAILGVIHRAVLRQGPVELQEFFQVSLAGPRRENLRSSERRHCRTVSTLCDGLFQGYCQRSALAMPLVYNLLPESIVLAPSVKSFQSSLQKLLFSHAQSLLEDWSSLFSVRLAMNQHPLLSAPCIRF